MAVINILRKHRIIKYFVFWAIAVFIPVIMIIAMTELVLRRDQIASLWGFDQSTANEGFDRPPASPSDTVLGWKTFENYQFSGEVVDLMGQRSKYRYSTGPYGFRHWPDNKKPDRPTILFIGDSFTESAYIDDTKTFYHHLAQHLDANVFAYGCGGYGNLQEFMILDRHMDEIKPDLVVVQTCENDFADNSIRLEERNQFGHRPVKPYLNLKNEIFYAQPRFRKILPFFQVWEHAHLRSLFWLNNSIWEVMWGPFEESLQKKRQNSPYWNDFQEANQITGMIFRRIKKRCDDAHAQLVVFSVNNPEKYPFHVNAIGDICKKEKITFLSEATELILAEEKNQGRMVCRLDDGANDGHFNQLGQRLLAEGLREPIRRILSDQHQSPEQPKP
jgi:hypothetical protein